MTEHILANPNFSLLPVTITACHAKYFARGLTRRATGRMNRLSMALFVLQFLLSKGAILADEVGLGKTAEAGNAFLYRLPHPLGEHVVDTAKMLPTLSIRIVFDVTRLPMHLYVIKALWGQTGYLALTRHTIHSYEREEYLLFYGFVEAGEELDQETMEKLFSCRGQTTHEGYDKASIPASVMWCLNDESDRHARGTVSRSLEQNNRHFNEAREKLERWADDMVLPAEKAFLDTKAQIKARRQQVRRVVTLTEQHQIQQKIQKLGRRQRQDVFKVEDQVIKKRDQLIDSLEARLARRTATKIFFTTCWAAE
ncbi:MAG: hypothetical protein OXD43_02730 [Bacteroidetes bacterium]|nr:hypothetical protein [Bacteroidota bacterium]